MPVGQAVTADWDSWSRWLENSSTDKCEEALIMAWHSDSAPWPTSWSAVTQCPALQWKWLIESLHCTTATMILCPVRLSIPLPYLKKRYLQKRISSALYFPPNTVKIRTVSFVIAWLYEKTPWGTSVFSPFPTGLRKPNSTQRNTLPALSASSFSSYMSSVNLSWEPNCLKATGRSCRATRIGKTAEGVPMI